MEPSLPLPLAYQPGALSREIVKIAVEYTGRGPTTVRTTIGIDVICVILQENHAKGERALLAAGEHALVGQLRRAYQHAMRPALIQAAQTLTGREVQALLADHDTHADVSSLSFVLVPHRVAAGSAANDGDCEAYATDLNRLREVANPGTAG